MASFEEKIHEGIVLSEKIFKLGMELVNQLPKADESKETESNRRAIAKGFLITSLQLSGQIIKAISNGSLSLSIVGLRSLLEFSINANYVFDHPKHKQDFLWIDPICDDIFKRTNDLGMMKSLLGGVSLKQRAIDIDRKDLYEQNYASLCDYAHLILRQPFLNNRETFEKLSVDGISQSLCNLVGVLDSIKLCFNLTWEQGVIDEVISYRDKYETPQVHKA